MVVLGDTRHGKSDDGKLISDEFTIDQPYLRFLYGGEVNPRVRVVLRVDVKVVRVAYGNNAYHLRLRGWDVREFDGKNGPSRHRGRDARGRVVPARRDSRP